MTVTHKKSLLIYLTALFVEIILLILVASHAGWSLGPYMTGFDTIEYQTLAQNLVENQTFSKSLAPPFIPNFFRSPGYPFWLAIIYWIFGSFKPAIFFGMLIFATSAVITYLIAREVFSEKLAFWSGIVFALEPRMAFSAPFLLSEQIFLPIFLLSLFFAVKFFNNPKEKKFILFSVFFIGLSSLIRGIALYVWPALMIFIFLKLYKRYRAGEILKVLVLSALTLIIVLSPWLIRNRLVFGTFQPSSLFGVQLYWGHLETLERYLGVPQEVSHQKNFDRAVKLVGDNFETPQAIDILTKEALAIVKENPLAYAKVYIFNSGLFFITDGYKGIASYIFDIKPNFINFGDFLVMFRFKEMLDHLKSFSFFDLAVPIFGRILWAVITALSFIGIFLSIKNIPTRRPILILFSFIIFYFAILTGPIFSPDPRFRMPVNVFLISFALVTVLKLMKKEYRYE